MRTTAIDAKVVLAALVVLGCFGMLILYVVVNRKPDDYVIAIVSASLSGVLSYFFGHANGTNSALAATALDSLTRARVLVNQQFPSPDVAKTP